MVLVVAVPLQKILDTLEVVLVCNQPKPLFRILRSCLSE